MPQQNSFNTPSDDDSKEVLFDRLNYCDLEPNWPKNVENNNDRSIDAINTPENQKALNNGVLIALGRILTTPFLTNPMQQLKRHLYEDPSLMRAIKNVGNKPFEGVKGGLEVSAKTGFIIYPFGAIFTNTIAPSINSVCGEKTIASYTMGTIVSTIASSTLDAYSNARGVFKENNADTQPSSKEIKDIRRILLRRNIGFTFPLFASISTIDYYQENGATLSKTQQTIASLFFSAAGAFMSAHDDKRAALIKTPHSQLTPLTTLQYAARIAEVGSKIGVHTLMLSAYPKLSSIYKEYCDEITR